MTEESPQNGNDFNAENQKNKKNGLKSNRWISVFLLIFIFFNFNKIIFMFFRGVKLPPHFLVSQAIKIDNKKFLIAGFDTYRIKFKIQGTNYYSSPFIDRDLQRFSDSYIFDIKSNNLKISDIFPNHKYKVKSINKEDNNIILIGAWQNYINQLYNNNTYNKIEEYGNDLRKKSIIIYKEDVENFIGKSKYGYLVRYAVEKYDKNKAFILTDTYTYIYDTKNRKIIDKKKNNLKIDRCSSPIKISKNEYLLFGRFLFGENSFSVIKLNTDDFLIKSLGKADYSQGQFIDEAIKTNDNIYCFSNSNNNGIERPYWVTKYDIQTDTFKNVYKFYGFATQNVDSILLKNNKILLYYRPTHISFIPPLLMNVIPIKSRCEIFDPQTEKVKKSLICPDNIVVSPIVLDSGDVMFIQEKFIKIVPEKFFK